MCMSAQAYLCTKRHVTSSNYSLVITIKHKYKQRFRVIAMFVLKSRKYIYIKTSLYQ